MCNDSNIKCLWEQGLRSPPPPKEKKCIQIFIKVIKVIGPYSFWDLFKTCTCICLCGINLYSVTLVLTEPDLSQWAKPVFGLWRCKRCLYRWQTPVAARSQSGHQAEWSKSILEHSTATGELVYLFPHIVQPFQHCYIYTLATSQCKQLNVSFNADLQFHILSKISVFE